MIPRGGRCGTCNQTMIFGGRSAKMLQQANAQAAQQQVDAEVTEARVLDQSRAVPMDETSPGQLAVGDRTRTGGPTSNTEHRRQPPEPAAKTPPAGDKNGSEHIDFLA